MRILFGHRTETNAKGEIETFYGIEFANGLFIGFTFGDVSVT